MKQFISTLIFASFVASLFVSSIGLAAPKKAEIKTSKKKVSKILTEENNWNKVCQDLLETSVKSTTKLEQSMMKKKKISKKEFDNKVHNELLVVQLNAWVCALSTQDQKLGAAAEELFLKDYSRLVQSKKL